MQHHARSSSIARRATAVSAGTSFSASAGLRLRSRPRRRPTHRRSRSPSATPFSRSATSPDCPTRCRRVKARAAPPAADASHVTADVARLSRSRPHHGRLDGGGRRHPAAGDASPDPSGRVALDDPGGRHPDGDPAVERSSGVAGPAAAKRHTAHPARRRRDARPRRAGRRPHQGRAALRLRSVTGLDSPTRSSGYRGRQPHGAAAERHAQNASARLS